MNKNLLGISGKLNSGKDTVANIIQILTGSPHFNNQGVLSSLNRENYDDVYKLKKFADLPNQAYKLITGIDYSNLPREEKEKERSKFVDFANNHMKNCFGQTLWVDGLFINYKPYKPLLKSEGLYPYYLGVTTEYPKWIISDVRLRIEADRINLLQGVNIRVNRFMTSAEWFHSIPDLIILDPDGWDKTNYDYSFYQEIIDFNEFFKRLSHSTISCNYDIVAKYQSPTEVELDDYQNFNYTIENRGTLLDLIQVVRQILEDLKLI